MRHSFLQSNIFDNSEKNQYPVYNFKREILGKKIIVKKLFKIYFSEK